MYSKFCSIRGLGRTLSTHLLNFPLTESQLSKSSKEYITLFTLLKSVFDFHPKDILSMMPITLLIFLLIWYLTDYSTNALDILANLHYKLHIYHYYTSAVAKTVELSTHVLEDSGCNPKCVLPRKVRLPE